MPLDPRQAITNSLLQQRQRPFQQPSQLPMGAPPPPMGMPEGINPMQGQAPSMQMGGNTGNRAPIALSAGGLTDVPSVSSLTGQPTGQPGMPPVASAGDMAYKYASPAPAGERSPRDLLKLIGMGG